MYIYLQSGIIITIVNKLYGEKVVDIWKTIVTEEENIVTYYDSCPKKTRLNEG